MTKCLLFPSLHWKLEGVFSKFHPENLVGFQEAKLMKLWVPLKTAPSLEFLSLKLVHTEPPAIHQLQFKLFQLILPAIWTSAPSKL